MSVSALTTAMAVAAATVPNNEAPASNATSVPEPVAADHEPQVVDVAAGSEASPPIVLAQSTPPVQLNGPGQSTELAESTDPQSTSPASSAQPAPQPPNAPGQIVVTGRRPTPEDPLEELNSKSFKVTESVDKALVAPIAFTYEKIMPRPIRKGLRNFLHNLGEPVVFINYLLQLKPGKAAETLGRFAINTTLGWGGIFDIAKRKPFFLPHRDNGFANTLGYYGVKPGPYFYLPVIGATTLRDFIGSRLDLLVLPTIFPKWFQKKEVIVPVWTLSELGRRIDADEKMREVRATQDPYVTVRTLYLQRRQAEIDALHGRKASTTKPPVTAPAPPAPVRKPLSTLHPNGQLRAGLLLNQTLTGDPMLGPSIIGVGQYSRLVSDFTRSPIVSLRGSVSHWSGAEGLQLLKP